MVDNIYFDRIRTLLGAIMLWLVVASTVNAGPFEDGVSAYKRGDYASVLLLVRPLAEQGDAEAQFFLGIMYDLGKGVTQDYAEAVKWYRMAADHGTARAQYSLGLE